MVDSRVERACQLKEVLTDFVYDTEGELAIALETFSAEQLSNKQAQSLNQKNLLIDRFITEGKVGDKSVIELFLATEKDLSESDRALVKGWENSFIGIFEIKEILPEGFFLMNWTTAKYYKVLPGNEQIASSMLRYKVGEILVSQIAPLGDERYVFSSPCMTLGRLGKPKLAVAINNFKQNYPFHLYSDAPDLLAESWLSVEKYHGLFVDFFGSDEVTLSGYELGKKLNEFSEAIAASGQETLGVEEGKTVQELAAQAGVSEEELESLVKEMGGDENTAKELLTSKGKPEMVQGQVELPAQLRKSEQVTALSHPRWGQYFLPTYCELKKVLSSAEGQTSSRAKALVNNYLTNPEISYFIWQRLAAEIPTQLEVAVKECLDRPDFNLNRDLTAIMKEKNKPIEPVLPEIASVPKHLHDLFQEAILEVKKTQAKPATGGKKRKN